MIHVNRSADVTSGYWDDPVNRVEPDVLDLRFVQYFDSFMTVLANYRMTRRTRRRRVIRGVGRT